LGNDNRVEPDRSGEAQPHEGEWRGKLMTARGSFGLPRPRSVARRALFA